MRKTNVKVRGLIVIFCILMLILLITPTKVHAVLQSNGDSAASKTINDWMLQVRKMQEAGGTLGLSDTINTTNLTSGNTNLDIHMEKNTEYGAMALLSASAYGKSDKVNSTETTTGNASGVVINLNNELVSAGTVTDAANYKNASPRYKNIYGGTYSPRNGDAITETGGWYSGATTWLYGYKGSVTQFYTGTIESSATLLRANRKYIWLFWKIHKCGPGFGYNYL